MAAHEAKSERQAAGRSASSRSLDGALAAVARHREERSLQSLAQLATDGRDPRVRIRALAALAEVFGAEALPILWAVIEDGAETDKVRREAARFLGRTGEDAGAELKRLLDLDLPPRVQGGAVLGMAESGTARGATRVYEIAAAPEHPMRLEASAALGRIVAPEAARQLVVLVTNQTAEPSGPLPEAALIAVCRSLGQSHVMEARLPLENFLQTETSAAVRAAAAHALGMLGQKDAMEALVVARDDSGPGVAPAVQIALSRLSHVQD